MKKPYVVSSDLGLVWGRRAGRKLSKSGLFNFRQQVRRSLEECFGFGSCDWVPEDELYEGMAFLRAKHESLPLVSFDKVYSDNLVYEYDVSRMVGRNGWDTGYGTTTGRPMDLREIVEDAARFLKKGEAAFVDDVIFSGTLFERLIDLFAERGIRIVHAYAGVAIQDGIKRLKKKGCTVHAVRTYREVVDEICERDFMPGAPLSGRTVSEMVNTGMPYLLPFGRPHEWASIPHKYERRHSWACLKASLDLYRSDSELMGMRCHDLPRAIYGIASSELLVSEALEQAYRSLSTWVHGHD